MPIKFEERYDIIVNEINKRRNKWTLASLDFEDVTQIILIRIFQKYDTYHEEEGVFIKWLNRVISNALKNILRDNYTKFSRPCILGCPFNLGDDACGYTPSKKQCNECPIFARWKERKEDHFNVAQSLPLENHAQEVSSIQQDSLDIAHAKDIIDIKMKDYLKPNEYRIYDLLYIQNKTPEEVGTLLKYKKSKNSDIPGYQIQRKLKHKFIELSKKIIEEEGLVN